MPQSWRKAGLNYLRFSNICAQVVREALKPEFKIEAEKRTKSIVKCVHWINGNPVQTRTDE